MKGGEEWQAAAMMIVINCALGVANALVKKTLDGGLAHMIVATYRLSISTIFLAPIAYFYERKTRPKLTLTILCQLFFSALLGATLTQYFFLLGLKHTSATLSCAFISMSPAVTFLMALACRIEKVKVKSKGGSSKILGTLICISGALFLTFYKGMALTSNAAHWQAKHHATTNSHIKAQNWVVGCALLLAGSIFWSSWFLIQAKINKRYPCQYSSISILSFFGSIQCALLSFINERHMSHWILKGKFDILTVIYIGVIGQGACTVGMSWCIKQKGPVFTSTFTPLMLIFATIFDFLVLHEPIYLGSVLGSCFIIIGCYIFLWGKTKEAEQCATKQAQLPCIEDFDQDSSAVPRVIPVTP
ncbi:WAT1-related protein At4g01440-like [Carica papaya]|uniref:WAT1-related protein At4g01440-like n=1 Tax=Carica papaya TaxID=3649 RepID=UPI000B8CD9D1|nr:WAT1-related protein At4g01440-like [Carica papaya]